MGEMYIMKRGLSKLEIISWLIFSLLPEIVILIFFNIMMKGSDGLFSNFLILLIMILVFYFFYIFTYALFKIGVMIYTYSKLMEISKIDDDLKRNDVRNLFMIKVLLINIFLSFLLFIVIFLSNHI